MKGNKWKGRERKGTGRNGGSGEENERKGKGERGKSGMQLRKGMGGKERFGEGEWSGVSGKQVGYWSRGKERGKKGW